MRRLYRGIAVILVVIAAGFIVQKLFGNETLAPHLVSSRPVAAIGSGSNSVAVAEDGTILDWVPASGAETLPSLPLGSPPKGRRVRGPALEQVRILAAAPAALLPYVEASGFGETGVFVELSSGIQLIFGTAGDAARKWRSAAAVLASPEVTSLDYVNVQAPGHPSVGGSGHALPPLP